MRIKKWETIINPKTHLRKPGGEEEGDVTKEEESDDPQQKEVVQESVHKPLPHPKKETVEEMFERRSVQSDLSSHDEKDRKMGVRDFDLEKDQSESNVTRVKALAQTYPFMFEQGFLDELKELEEKKRKENREQD